MFTRVLGYVNEQSSCHLISRARSSVSSRDEVLDRQENNFLCARHYYHTHLEFNYSFFGEGFQEMRV